MQFYLITGIIENEKWEEESDSRMERVRIRRQIYAKTEVFNRDLGDQAFVSLVDTENGFAQILAMLQQPLDLDSLVSGYLELMELPLGEMDTAEISFKDAKDLLHAADRHDYIFDADDILRRFDLDDLGGYRRSRRARIICAPLPGSWQSRKR